MPSAGPERSPSNTPTLTPSGRRFFSRITSPFAHKTRKLTDFYIEVDDPHRQYSPGDLVTGCVNLKVVQPTRVTHVVVCLHGFVQVYKNPGSPPSDGYRANGAHIGTGRGAKTGEYFGNGFCTLFEDEVVLCGDGRLGEGTYKFQFNLEFPDRDLPSSISFERGTISYMITATLTRPTTISPTIQCDHKVYMVERIDISQLIPPKARTITLEPISRRTRAKTQARRVVDNVERKSRKDGSGTQNTSDQERRDSQTSSSPSRASLGAAADEVPQSPAHSEISFDSRLSSFGRPSHHDSNTTSPRQSDAERTNGSRISLSTKTITATVETLSGGCLRGDSVGVRVHVNHTKHVKSLHGVIITLYRQARVDMHPSIPLGPTEKGKEAKYEDYYPKSVTGLGGLSLSGAGSSHMFRKDLSQTVVPLIVDPGLLTAEVTGRVHVPEECFPTISTVPGAMISFRYYIEVVLDIQGKLSSQDRNFSNLGGLASTINHGATTGDNPGTGGFGPHQSPVIDTAAVRRDKGVVACTFEVVVGTKDSARKKGKRRADPSPDPESGGQQQPSTDAQGGATPQPENGHRGNEAYYGHDGSTPQYYGQGQHDYNDYHGYDGYAGYNGYADQYGYWPPETYEVEPPVPMPPIEDETQLSEKERLRRAEARLLPSQPPGAEQGESSSQPSAPYLPDEHVNGFAGASASPDVLLTPPAFTVGPSNHAGLMPLDYARNIPLPRTPEYEPRQSETLPAFSEQSTLTLTPARTQAAAGATDDKRELERRELQAEASAPPGQEAGSSSQASSSQRSTAPNFTEEDLYGDAHVPEMHDHNELPKYER
ncbi:pH-response regulator protein palF/RIM8 [Pseudocercospora fuligena]|uniref:pH-response regulator protein palF/RIM8 n=1 Tax=Pseudocercospora fuligena TaxID=685502 RepID=A0A8H6RI23_9PEZI|nr:pH-response regulator protein palF/RIM8 [Pseudocercospora fuligena]